MKFYPWQTECAMRASDKWYDGSRSVAERRDALRNALLKAVYYRSGMEDAYEQKSPEAFERASIMDTCDMAGLSYTNISSGSGDAGELVNYFPKISRQDLNYIQNLFYMFLESDGSANGASDEEILDFCDEIVECYFEGDPFEIDPEEEKQRLLRTAKGFNNLSEGDTSGLKDPLVSDFIDDLKDIFEPMLDEGFVAGNLDLFTPTLFQACCDYSYCTHIIGSEEIYWYKLYRDKILEEDVRESVDNALYVFNNPFPLGYSDAASVTTGETEVEGRHYHILSFVTTAFPSGEFSVKEENISVFWQSAASYLNEVLPNLRKRYGDASDGVSVLFLCPFSDHFQIMEKYCVYPLMC